MVAVMASDEVNKTAVPQKWGSCRRGCKAWRCVPPELMESAQNARTDQRV